MHHDRERQDRLERVLGDQADFSQILIEIMDVGRRVLDPAQLEIGGRHQFHVLRIRVDRVFARLQRGFPHAALAGFDQFAVLVILAGNIVAARPGVADHDTDMTDADLRLAGQFHGGEQPVDVISAFHQHLFLPAPPAAGGQKARNILEAVVEIGREFGVGADGRRDDFAMFERRAVLHRHDRDAIAVDHHRFVALARGDQAVQRARLVGVAELDLVHALVGQHHEQGGVDGVGGGTQDAALRAALPALRQKRGGVAGVHVGGPHGQRLAFGERRAGAGEQVADAAHGDQFLPMHAVLVRHERVPAAADRVGQKAGAAARRHEAGAGAGAERPGAFDDAETVVRDEDEAAAGEQDQHEQQQTDPQRLLKIRQIGRHEMGPDRPGMGLGAHPTSAVPVLQRDGRIAVGSGPHGSSLETFRFDHMAATGPPGTA